MYIFASQDCKDAKRILYNIIRTAFRKGFATLDIIERLKCVHQYLKWYIVKLFLFLACMHDFNLQFRFKAISMVYHKLSFFCL